MRFFYLIGGTPTGAIIVTALALGMTVKQVKDLYFDFGHEIFRTAWLAVPNFKPRFNARALTDKLRAILEARFPRSL